MRIRDELDPGRIVRPTQVLVHPVVAAHARLARLLRGCIFASSSSAAFAMVARLACAHQVLPPVRSAAVARNHVVQRQLFGLFPAILAGVVVPQEYFLRVSFATGCTRLMR